MKYITIDGDNIGQKITSSYLRNDLSALSAINNLVNEKTTLIAKLLKDQGFTIIFCAADGVAGYCNSDSIDETLLYDEIRSIAGDDISFSVGIGSSLRESYVALLSAKSAGKARLHSYERIEK
jgi:hypothetical protein